MKYIIAILFAACVLLATPVVHAEEQLVAVVVNAESGITTISAKQVRRAYLGASIVLNGIEIKPLLNETNKLASEVFMQRVMFMSAEAYERQLISRSFQGGIRPKVYEDLPELLSALHKDNAAITFMLYQTAVDTPGIRIIGRL
ncbi:MAG TPA: hypothetical protein VMJ33_04230 [Gallionella sp.]|nr:hypothetical protein [Gallionella sp.]